MDKAYVVANEQQKNKIREKSNDKADFDSQAGVYEFPYVLVDSEADGWIYYSTMWSAEYDFGDHLEIVFDGRKEEKMADKYVVSQEFMNALKKWKDNLKMNGKHSVYDYDIHEFSDIIEDWWSPVGIRDYEQNNRLIAILRWVNGEDVFEVEKPKKWVVRSKEHDEGGHYQYVIAGDFDMSFNEYHIEHATRFDTQEEAESWANAHQEVIEVKE